MASLFLDRSINVKQVLINFLTDIVINDAYMEHTVRCVKQCFSINQQYRPKPFSDIQPSWVNPTASHGNSILMTGSFAEGLSVPPLFDAICIIDKSDCDIICVIPLLTCDMDTSSGKPTFLINTQYTHNGYCHLTWNLNMTNFDHLKTIQSMIDDSLRLYPYANDTKTYCLPSLPLPPSWLSAAQHPNMERHGPAEQVNLQFVTAGLNAIYSFDSVTALYCPSWPSQKWIERQRSHAWPTTAIVQDIVKRGCHVVPVAHPTSSAPEIEWRYSFSLAELILANKISYYTRKTYIMFKLLCKKFLNDDFPLKTYYLKTILFWCCEEYPTLFVDDEEILLVKVGNIAEKLDKLIDKLLYTAIKRELPSYFIQTNNLYDLIGLDNFSESKMETIINKIKYLKDNKMQILFNTILESHKLDYCLPFYFNVRQIFEPVLKYWYPDADCTPMKSDCERVIEQLSISLFLEAKPYSGRKLLQTIWYTLLERLPLDDSEACNLITEHDYYSLVYKQYQESLIDQMLHVQEELLKYFKLTDNETSSNENIILLRSLGYLHCIKSGGPSAANRHFEFDYFRKAFLKAIETTINSEAQQTRCYLAYALYFCWSKRYEEALVLLKTVIKLRYHLFNKDIVTIYTIHKQIHSEDIQHLLHIYNAINIPTKTYILYLLCRVYKLTGQLPEGRQTIEAFVNHITEIHDVDIGYYLLGQLCLLYGDIQSAYYVLFLSLRNEYDLNPIFEPSKTMMIFKASLFITTYLKLSRNRQTIE
jgi:hypothetical protein